MPGYGFHGNSFTAEHLAEGRGSQDSAASGRWERRGGGGGKRQDVVSMATAMPKCTSLPEGGATRFPPTCHPQGRINLHAWLFSSQEKLKHSES
jgi:hypothetical protein